MVASRVQFAAVVLCAGLGAFASTARAAVVNVYLHDFYFSTNPNPEAPAITSVTINPGDTVRWTWVANFHNVREVLSEPALFSSPFSSTQGTTFEYTFNTPGFYLYICDIHGSHAHGNLTAEGMSGSVTVVPAPGAVAVLALGATMLRRRR